MREELKQVINEAHEILLPHGFDLYDAYTKEYNDHKNYSKIFAVALGFICIEDLAMAKLLLRCDIFS